MSHTLVKSFLAPIQGKKRIMKVELNRYTRESDGRIKAYSYCFIKATVVESGFNLCHLHQGYFNHKVDCNVRLRSKKSIDAEMLNIYENFKVAILERSEKMLVFPTKVTAKITGEDFFINNVNHADAWQHTVNIKSKQSGKSVSWHFKDVYNNGEIELEVTRLKDGRLRFIADETKLYNQVKLQELANSERFQNRKYSFTFYNEILRLVGQEHGNVAEMNGLFA